MAQHPRDSWNVKYSAETPYTLADAPLASTEREQVYQALEKEMHGSYTDADRDRERRDVMSALVGWVALAQNGNKQLLVRGPNPFCGATGNCTTWIFVRRGGEWRPVLREITNRLVVRRSSSQGFHDIATGEHSSAFDQQYRDYRWDGSKYKQTDCYETIYPQPDEPGGPPMIADCN
jgi:hypothetical protein